MRSCYAFVVDCGIHFHSVFDSKLNLGGPGREGGRPSIASKPVLENRVSFFDLGACPGTAEIYPNTASEIICHFCQIFAARDIKKSTQNSLILEAKDARRNEEEPINLRRRIRYRKRNQHAPQIEPTRRPKIAQTKNTNRPGEPRGALGDSWSGPRLPPGRTRCKK